MQAVESRSSVPLVVVAVLGVLTLAVGKLVDSGQGVRVALTVVLVIVFAGLAFLSPKHLILTMAVWLACLGLVRRVVGGSLLEAGDPLLVVGPASLIILAIVAAGKNTKLKKTSLTYLVLLLQIAAFLSIFNPLQGGVMVGLAGLLFIPIPTLAFWAGRAFCDDRSLTQVFKLIGLLALPAALYGLYQSFYGFPSWDSQWLNSFGYVSLNVNGVTRPFASFSSATDYNTFLGLGLVAWTMFMLRKRPIIGVTISLVLFLALVYGSQRLIIVTGLGGVALVLAARRQWPMGGALCLGLFLLVTTPFLLSYFEPQLDTFQAQSPLLEHQIQGLADPFGQNSTLRLRTEMVTAGVSSAAENPLGLGIGAPTIAATRFGGSAANLKSTDADPSNMAVALGVPGLVLYLALSFVAFRRAYNLAVERRDALSYAVLAALGITVTQWLTGGQYAVAWIPWLLLGWVDKQASLPDGPVTARPREARTAVPPSRSPSRSSGR